MVRSWNSEVTSAPPHPRLTVSRLPLVLPASFCGPQGRASHSLQRPSSHRSMTSSTFYPSTLSPHPHLAARLFCSNQTHRADKLRQETFNFEPGGSATPPQTHHAASCTVGIGPAPGILLGGASWQQTGQCGFSPLLGGKVGQSVSGGRICVLSVHDCSQKLGWH